MAEEVTPKEELTGERAQGAQEEKISQETPVVAQLDVLGPDD